MDEYEFKEASNDYDWCRYFDEECDVGATCVSCPLLTKEEVDENHAWMDLTEELTWEGKTGKGNKLHTLAFFPDIQEPWKDKNTFRFTKVIDVVLNALLINFGHIRNEDQAPEYLRDLLCCAEGFYYKKDFPLFIVYPEGAYILAPRVEAE